MLLGVGSVVITMLVLHTLSPSRGSAVGLFFAATFMPLFGLGVAWVFRTMIGTQPLLLIDHVEKVLNFPRLGLTYSMSQPSGVCTRHYWHREENSDEIRFTPVRDIMIEFEEHETPPLLIARVQRGPWHDPGLHIAKRLSLELGLPLREETKQRRRAAVVTPADV